MLIGATKGASWQKQTVLIIALSSDNNVSEAVSRQKTGPIRLYRARLVSPPLSEVLNEREVKSRYADNVSENALHQ